MLWIPIERSSAKPLIRQVYEQVRTQILCGTLQAGEQLPSTRALATSLHVSRNVVLEAYDQLLAEGYIESRAGSGTYVAEGTRFTAEQHLPEQQTLTTHPPQSAENLIDFRSGLPALDLFPRKQWSQIAQHVYAEIAPSAFGYDSPEGRLELRTVLARYLLRTRGVRCHPEQMLILSGAAQAFSLLTRLLVSTSNKVIVEDPVTDAIQIILSSSDARLIPIPVDEHGMRTDMLPSACQHFSFILVTPSHQFPLGGILSIQRRIQLLQFAHASGCYLVEDDYDSEFRYTGSPISSLQSLEPGRVIYVGTFSKILSPALRLGYMILPEELVERCRRIKQLTDLHSPSLEQLVLARFIDAGHLERHIARMKRLYQRRRNTLIHALNTHFPHQVTILGDATGLHLVAQFPHVAFSQEIIATIEQAGVRVYPVEQHAINQGRHTDKIILGYSHLSHEQIEQGIKQLKKALCA
jgi:GntR family transcriptional regulator/MocR family aminotransferase